MARIHQGHEAEEIALDYLFKKGYKFIAKNFYSQKKGELDLIMRDGEFIVFIEVKSLRKGSQFYIYETLTKSKKRKIYNSINSWLYQHNESNSIWRFDFIGILLDNKDIGIEHFEFEPLR